MSADRLAWSSPAWTRARTGSGPGFHQGPRDYSEVYVRVFNHSDEPIWDVKVPVPGREARPLLYERVDPHSSELNGWLDAPADWHLMHVSAGCPGTPHWIPLDVAFVDNSGRRWRRSGRSEPVRLMDAEDQHPLFAERGGFSDLIRSLGRTVRLGAEGSATTGRSALLVRCGVGPSSVAPAGWAVEHRCFRRFSGARAPDRVSAWATGHRTSKPPAPRAGRWQGRARFLQTTALPDRETVLLRAPESVPVRREGPCLVGRGGWSRIHIHTRIRGGP